MQIRFELKSDNTFTALPYKDGNKEDEDPIAGDWKVDEDEIVLSGKDQGNDEEVGFRFNKDTLELTAMMVKGENQLDNLKEFMGDEAMKLKNSNSRGHNFKKPAQASRLFLSGQATFSTRGSSSTVKPSAKYGGTTCESSKHRGSFVRSWLIFFRCVN